MSNYSVLEPLAGGAAALVQWKLNTGRTHQIRVHAKHIGHPLFGDETYSSAGSALSMIGRNSNSRREATPHLLPRIASPCVSLNARVLNAPAE